MDIRKFLPGVGKRRMAIPPERDPGEFQISWTRRRVPQTGGQNYSLSTLQLALNDLSGPLPYYATPIKPVGQPTLAYPLQQGRAIPTVTVTGRNTLTGQFFGQPLYDPESQGFTSSRFPVNARPYNINGIVPAGVI